MRRAAGSLNSKEKGEEKRLGTRAGQKGRAKVGQMAAKRAKKEGKARQRRAKGSHLGVREGQRGPKRGEKSSGRVRTRPAARLRRNTYGGPAECAGPGLRALRSPEEEILRGRIAEGFVSILNTPSTQQAGGGGFKRSAHSAEPCW